MLGLPQKSPLLLQLFSQKKWNGKKSPASSGEEPHVREDLGRVYAASVEKLAFVQSMEKYMAIYTMLAKLDKKDNTTLMRLKQHMYEREFTSYLREIKAGGEHPRSPRGSRYIQRLLATTTDRIQLDRTPIREGANQGRLPFAQTTVVVTRQDDDRWINMIMNRGTVVRMSLAEHQRIAQSQSQFRRKSPLGICNVNVL